jgi:hypothetical protein
MDRKTRYVRLLSGKIQRTYRTYTAFRLLYPFDKFTLLRGQKIYQELMQEIKYTLHFRIDYSSDREGHDFYMQDSHLTMKFTRQTPLQEVHNKMMQQFKKILYSLGWSEQLISMVQHDTIQGLEKDNPQLKEGDFKIKWKYGKGGSIKAEKGNISGIDVGTKKRDDDKLEYQKAKATWHKREYNEYDEGYNLK